MTILDLAQTDTNRTFRKQSRRNGGEYVGPCPLCRAGDDRFHVWPQTGRYWCRICDQKGDTIQYLRDVRRMGYYEARDYLNLPPADGPKSERPLQPPPNEEPPSEAWRARAQSFSRYTQDTLWGAAGAQARDYLGARHLTGDTLELGELGYNPAPWRDERDRWGLEPAVDKRGRPKRVWLPRGVVIPVIIGGDIWQIIIRRPNEDLRDKDDRKYVQIEGGAGSVLYGADGIKPGRPAVLVEGYLDALAVQQAAGDLAAVVAAGTTTGARRMRWVTRLALASPVLVSFDADEAGENAAEWWLAGLGKTARRWRPYFDDPAAMLETGADVRAWIESGL